MGLNGLTGLCSLFTINDSNQKAFETFLDAPCYHSPNVASQQVQNQGIEVGNKNSKRKKKHFNRGWQG